MKLGRHLKKLITKRAVRNLIIFGFVLGLGVSACSYLFLGTEKDRKYLVGYDRNWQSINLQGREVLFSAFLKELFQAISNSQEIEILLVPNTPQDLMSQINRRELTAILSTTAPMAISPYIYSDPIFLLGPVLIVPESSNIHSLKDMLNMTIGVHKGSSLVFDIEQYPRILIRSYDNILTLLNDVSNNVIDGAILERLTAHTYVEAFFDNKLKIIPQSLNSFGLRLIALSSEKEFINLFNKSLRELIESQAYKNLLEKWGLPDTMQTSEAQ